MKQNSKGDTNDDYNFYRCKRCGFPIDLSRDKEAPRMAMSFTSHTGVSSLTVPKNVTPKAGCPFCGCVNYRNWQQ